MYLIFGARYLNHMIRLVHLLIAFELEFIFGELLLIIIWSCCCILIVSRWCSSCVIFNYIPSLTVKCLVIIAFIETFRSLLY